MTRPYTRKDKKRQEEYRDELKDGYVRQLMSKTNKSVNSMEWPDWLVEIYRLHIILKREVYAGGKRMYTKA